MRNFCKGFLIGLAAVCIMALGWLFIIQPGITRYETQSIKAAYTKQSPRSRQLRGAILYQIQRRLKRPCLTLLPCNKHIPMSKHG